MTMTMMRQHVKKQMKTMKKWGREDLADWYKRQSETLETLWKEGTVEYFDNDFLSYANGYQINTGDYEEVHVLQTYDLRRISASKKGVKALADAIFSEAL